MIHLEDRKGRMDSYHGYYLQSHSLVFYVAPDPKIVKRRDSRGGSAFCVPFSPAAGKVPLRGIY